MLLSVIAGIVLGVYVYLHPPKALQTLVRPTPTPTITALSAQELVAQGDHLAAEGAIDKAIASYERATQHLSLIHI